MLRLLVKLLYNCYTKGENTEEKRVHKIHISYKTIKLCLMYLFFFTTETIADCVFQTWPQWHLPLNVLF